MNWIFTSKTMAGVTISAISAAVWVISGEGIECSVLYDMQSQITNLLSMAGLFIGPALSAYGRIDREHRGVEK